MHATLLTLGAAAICAGAPQRTAAQGQPVELFSGSFAGWSIENAPDGNIEIREGVLHIGGSAGWRR